MSSIDERTVSLARYLFKDDLTDKLNELGAIKMALLGEMFKAWEVIKPIADVYAEAHEQRTGPFADRKYDKFTLNEETVRRCAQWIQDNQERRDG